MVELVDVRVGINHLMGRGPVRCRIYGDGGEDLALNTRAVVCFNRKVQKSIWVWKNIHWGVMYEKGVTDIGGLQKDFLESFQEPGFQGGLKKGSAWV